MNAFNCEKCGQPFKMEHHLKQHLARKRPCIVEDNNVGANRCIYCKKSYSTKSNLNKHSAKCRMKNGGIERIPQPVMQIAEQLRVIQEDQKKRDEEQKKRDEEKDKEMAEIRAIMKDLLTRPAVVNVNNHGNVTTNNIVINTFDNPNLQYLFDKANHATVRHSIEKHLIAFPMELVTPIWYNTNRPENHSVIVDPKKPSMCRVLCDHGWEMRSTEESANELRKLASDAARKLVREIAPDIKNVCGGIEDRKYSQGPGTKQDIADIIKKMIMGSQMIASK